LIQHLSQILTAMNSFAQNAKRKQPKLKKDKNLRVT